jgi:hypothetical protein
MELKSPRHDRPRLSRIIEGVAPYGVDIFISGMDGASDVALLRDNGITTVVNCAVNLDFNYVTEPAVEASESRVGHGWGAIRYYKIGLVDGPGNPQTMMLAGYYLLQGAFSQILPERASYPRRERGNVLVNCRGGRSRSVVLVALFLHHAMPEQFRTLDAALDHVRARRELRADEWFEAPKPMLIAAARRASEWIRRIDAESDAGS